MSVLNAVAPEVPLSVLNAVAPEVPLESRNAEPLKFDLDAILAATSNFSEENKLRECSLGHVYKVLFTETTLKSV